MLLVISQDGNDHSFTYFVVKLLMVLKIPWNISVSYYFSQIHKLISVIRRQKNPRWNEYWQSKCNFRIVLEQHSDIHLIRDQYQSEAIILTTALCSLHDACTSEKAQ